jgi:hypothetical protein
VLLSLLWSALVVSMSHLESRSYTGGGKDCQWWCSRVSVDASASTYAGFPLFLLLGFRVNEAYGRYLEAATIWGVELKMHVIQFLTQVGTAFRPGLFHTNDRERIFAITAAFVETLKRDLRDERDLGEVRYMLSKADAENILSADDMPDYCLFLLNAYVLKAASKPDSEVPVPGPWYPMIMGLLQNLSRCKGTLLSPPRCNLLETACFGGTSGNLLCTMVISDVVDCPDLHPVLNTSVLLTTERCVRIRQYRVVYGYVAHLHML